MKFWASVPGTKPGAPPRQLIIVAESSFDARAYAQRVLGAEGLLFQTTGEDAGPDVALRWVGSDAGQKPDRHLEVSERLPGGGMGEWRRV